MNILNQLWYGNIAPMEQGEYWTEESKDLLQLYMGNRGKLSATLNVEEKEMLEKIHDCYLEMQQFAECRAFKLGFRLAIQIMAESMAGYQE